MCVSNTHIQCRLLSECTLVSLCVSHELVPTKNKHLGNALVLAAATLYVYNPVHQDYKQLGSAVCLCVCGMCC